jgi:hypothetical protein
MAPPRAAAWAGYAQPVNGELAQLVALATYGNAWFAGSPDQPAPDLEHGNSTFQHVARVLFRFHAAKAGPDARPSVAEWLALSRERGTTRLSLHIPVPTTGSGARIDRLPDRIASGLSGGVHWGLVAESGAAARAWLPTWAFLGDPELAGGTWEVTYDEMGAVRGLAPFSDIGAAHRDLMGAVERAEAFAASQGWQDWREWLASARAADVPRFHPDLLPPDGFGDEARQLVAIAASAWVFGGMGSWNDGWPSEGQVRMQYDAVSDDLYLAICAAFVTAVAHGLDAGGS